MGLFDNKNLEQLDAAIVQAKEAQSTLFRSIGTNVKINSRNILPLELTTYANQIRRGEYIWVKIQVSAQGISEITNANNRLSFTLEQAMQAIRIYESSSSNNYWSKILYSNPQATYQREQISEIANYQSTTIQDLNIVLDYIRTHS